MGKEASPKRHGIAPDLTVLDVVSTWRGTEAVFKRYDRDAGECICCNALFDTLGRMAERYGLDLTSLLRDLESAAENAKGDGPKASRIEI